MKRLVGRTSTELLCHHDHESGQRRTPYTSNDKELYKSSPVSTSITEMFFTTFDEYLLDISVSQHNFFKSHLCVNII